ncbi:unnamed protein product [Cuscuta epithymum]|uniref:Uncharacterized protein n=1 Tax=Cuscuta epithymum TaxID=186058 RepID=A0AAV0DH02_9ASTE|nr:unnamed protein product [Cuscuta epithymum]CAH9100548.1 unnamed protein product [Cuscuta epithymum]
MKTGATIEESEGESMKIDRPSTLYVLSPKHLFVINILGSSIGSCSVKKLRNPFAGMIELESRILLVGGKAPHVPDYLYYSPSYNIARKEIFEVKQGSWSIVPSKIMPSMNEGKKHPIVQKFGTKVFVLHMGSRFVYDRTSGRYSTKVFELFDFACPEKGWVVKSVPFFDGSPSGWYRVVDFLRIGEKLYLLIALDYCGECSYVFNLKTEEWSEDDPFFWRMGCPPIDLGLPVGAVSAPGLDDETYVVFGFFDYFLRFGAALFTEGKGCSCYQKVDGIFNLEGLRRKRMACQFVEMGNGDYLGLLTAQDEKTFHQYLLVSIFSLEVLAAQVPPNPSLDKPIKTTFLSVNRKNQHKFNIRGAPFSYFAGAVCL